MHIQSRQDLHVRGVIFCRPQCHAKIRPPARVRPAHARVVSSEAPDGLPECVIALECRDDGVGVDRGCDDGSRRRATHARLELDVVTDVSFTGIEKNSAGCRMILSAGRSSLAGSPGSADRSLPPAVQPYAMTAILYSTAEMSRSIDLTAQPFGEWTNRAD